MHSIVREKRDQIELACRRNGVARLDVFGSAARAIDFVSGTSDVDLLVEFEKGRKTDTFLVLKEDFEQLLECQVDLVDRTALEASRNYIRRARILSETENVFLA